MVKIGNWPDEMILVFNQIGMYCEENDVPAQRVAEAFEAGILATHVDEKYA